MKKFLLVVLAAVGLASCVQTEELSVANNNEAIAFDTFVENATKAMHTTESLKSFNVYGTISQIDANGAKGDYVTTIFNAVPVTKGTNGWSYNSEFTQYWIPGFHYDFAAVVDGKVEECENGLPTTISTNLEEQKDVLYAFAHRDFTAGQSAAKVSFEFAHLLSKAKFTVKNAISKGSDFVYNVESIIIKNADKNAEYEVASEEWTATNTYEAPFGAISEIGQQISKDNDTEVLLVPGTKELKIEIAYNLTYKGAPLISNDTKKLTAVLTLEKGNAYNFIVEFGAPGEEIEFNVEKVVDWDTDFPGSVSHYVSSAAALTEALGKGLSVILDKDIDFGSTQLAITGENQVVDLGGHALTTANNWGGISLKNGASIKNGTITHTGNTAAIKAFNGTSVENVTINATCTTADKTVTGIAVQQGANVESIKNVTINGVSQGIEVGYQATVGLIEKAVVNESNNGTAKGIALVINGGKVGKAKDCTFKGETYGVTMHLKGVFAVGLVLENCQVEGTTASIYAWDEKGISNTSGSLNLTYDAATTLTGPFVWDFEDECQSVVTLNRPQ